MANQMILTHIHVGHTLSGNELPWCSVSLGRRGKVYVHEVYSHTRGWALTST